jgi:HPt (histidine-containing phosphotransfer) domain-containing protein
MNKNVETDSQVCWNLPELLVRVDNDQELLRELLAIFREDFPLTSRSLEVAVAAGDLKNAAAVSHTLKGMLANIGGTRASAAAARLEALASTGEKAALQDALDVLQCESATLLRELNAYLAEVRH